MIDVTDATFETDVVERSASTPVIVDLWAPWCGPCKTLGPMLESAVAATNGAVVLAKVNVDENPAISQAFKVQSIPAVFAIVDGKVVDSFIGAKPESELVHFVASLQPTLDEVALLMEAGDEVSLRKALELDPNRLQGILALAAILIEQRRSTEAAALLVPFLPDPEVEALLSSAVATEESLTAAFIEAAAEFDVLLETVKSDEAAKHRALVVLEGLPASDARTVALRKRFSARLF